MANLQIKGIQNELYDELKRIAAAENRSVSQQVVFLLKEYLARKTSINTIRTPAQALLELSGSWEDDKSAEQIVVEIRKARKNSEKLAEGF
jgi:hypothetical protein